MTIKLDWIENEFKELSLGDNRLNERMKYVASSFAKSPSLPINQASDDWHATKASYRFFANNKVTPEKIIAPHLQKTLERALNYDYVYVVQDTTVIDYTRHQKTQGLGCIGGQLKAKYNTHGMVMHTSLAFLWRRQKSPPDFDYLQTILAYKSQK